MNDLSNYKDLAATLIIVAAIAMLALSHTVVFADIKDILTIVVTFWFVRSGFAYNQQLMRTRLAALQPPEPPAHEEEKHS